MTDNSSTLGRRKVVPLRQIWKSESEDFTPWLAREDNLRLLGNTIGFDDLELVAREKKVGLLSADLVCRIKDTSEKVVIENQFEKADHQHLGKLLTYSAEINPVAMVWIAEQFDDQRRAALDWLNNITASGFSFFGVEVEAATIDGSRPAVEFKIVAKPNGWNRNVRRQGAPKRKKKGTTETKQLQLKYWTAFHDYLEQHDSKLKHQKLPADNGLHFMIGKTGIRLEAIAPGPIGEIRVDLVFYQARRKPYFDSWQEEKETIEQAVGKSLIWRTKNRRIIRICRSADVIKQRHAWEEQHAWLMEHLEAFDRVFRPRIGAFDDKEPLQKGLAAGGSST